MVGRYDFPVNDRFRLRDSGFTGGGQIGYNYQLGSFVLGLEGDIGYAGLSKSGFARNAFAPDVTTSADGGFVATLRPRIGYTFDRLLVYGTAGLAVANLRTSITDSCTVAPCNANTIAVSKDSTRLGLAIGAGLEYKLDQHWTTKVEYLHTGFGGTAATGMGADGNSYSWRNSLDENTVRAGLNYKF